MSDEQDNKSQKESNSLSTSYRNFRRAKEFLIEEIRRMKTEADAKEIIIQQAVNEMVRLGINVEKELFVPEYIGFTHIVFDQNEGRPVRVYKRGQYVLTRHPFDSKTWILNDNRQSIQIVIPNMLVGIIVLESLGVDVSLEKYLQPGSIEKESGQ